MTTTRSENGQCVFLALRDGIHIRNYANPALIQTLVQSGYEIVLLVPEPEHPQIRAQFAAPCFRFERMDVAALDRAMRDNRWSRIMRTARRHALGGAWFWNIASLRCLATIHWREQAPRSNWFGKTEILLAFFLAALLGRFLLMRRLMRWTERRQASFNAHAEIYERYRPSLTMVASSGYLYDALLMREARQHDAKVAVAIKNWDVPTTKGIGADVPDHVFVWNDTMRNEMIRHHDVPANQIKVTGIPQWDHYFAPLPADLAGGFRARYKIPEGRRVIYFATTSPIFYDDNFAVARIILNAMRDGRISAPTHFLLRLHPQYFDLKTSSLAPNVSEELAALERDFSDILSVSVPTFSHDGGLQIIHEEQETLLREILAASDLMVTIYSTQIIEATLFGLPVINVGMYQFRGIDQPMSICATWPHNLQIGPLNGTTDCTTENALVAAINADLTDRKRLDAGRTRIADKIIATELRGKSGVALGHALVEAART